MKFTKFFALLIFCFSLKAEGYLLMDDESETFLSGIVEKIKDALGFEGTIKIYISSDQTLNAAATQSGDIIVNAGAITQCSNSKELIAILAHEIGHVAGVHVTTYLANRTDFLKAGLVPALIGVVASICSQNGAPVMAGLLSGQSLGTGMALSKLRQKESIADTKAIQSIERLNWWPVFEGFVSIYEKLNSDSIIFNKYLSTHPLSQDRIAKFKKYRDLNKPISQKTIDLLQDFENRFQTIKHKIRALTISSELAGSLYKTFKNKNEKYARAVILYRLNKYQTSIKLINELLIESPNNAYYTEIKSMSLINLRKCNEAANEALRILKNDRNTTIHRDLGIIYGDAVFEGKLNSQIPQAIKFLKKILSRYNDDLSTINLLGNLYQLSGKEYSSKLYASRAAYIIGDVRMAKIHAEKAIKSSDPAIKRQAEDILYSLKEHD